MCETSWPLVLAQSDSNGNDCSTVLEELLDGPLLGPESEVTNEHSCDVFASCGSSTSLVSSWSLSGELNVDGSSVELLFIGASLGLSSRSVVVVFNESLSFSIEQLNLGQSSVWREHASERVLGGIVGKSSSEELNLSSVLVVDFLHLRVFLGHGCLS